MFSWRYKKNEHLKTKHYLSLCLKYFTATVFNNANQHINVYGDDVEVDYRGYEVRIQFVKNFAQI